jgi:hypothetical protein
MPLATMLPLGVTIAIPGIILLILIVLILFWIF